MSVSSTPLSINAVVIAACVSLGGCSLFMSGAPPKQDWERRQPGQPVSCTQSPNLPILDTVVAGGSAALAGGLIVAGGDCGDVCGAQGAIFLMAGAAALIWGLSAWGGFSDVDTCKEYEAATRPKPGPFQ